MRRFRDIVEDIKAPSPQSLWLDKGKLKFFGTKGWTLMAGEEGPDLSGYAKLSGATFTGTVIGNSASFTDLYNTTTGTLYIGSNSVGAGRLLDKDPKERSITRTYNTKGGFAELGTIESFVFTLEDGSKVTKSIRVVSTTTTPAT